METASTSAKPTVFVDASGGVATITMNRPERRNAASWDLLTGLVDALELTQQDPGVRVVVLTGAGGDFCVGADLSRVGSSDSADQDTRTLRGRSFDDDIDRLTTASTLIERLVSFPKPTIAAVSGACAGVGLSMALATDLQVVDRGAVLATAFVSAAVSGDLGSAWLLTRAVGSARARSLILDPVRLSGEQAAHIGLVTEAVDEVDGRVQELATKLSDQAPLAMRLAKRNLDDAELSLREYLQLEVPRMVETARSQDARIAAQAFMQKIKPQFVGE